MANALKCVGSVAVTSNQQPTANQNTALTNLLLNTGCWLLRHFRRIICGGHGQRIEMRWKCCRNQ